MKRILTVMLFVVLIASGAEAVQTKIVIRAKAKDAKFIGSMMGGAMVIIRDADTNEILAKGMTAGGTGNTQKIMIEPLKRGGQSTDATTAKFEATVDINEPRLVTVEILAPVGQRQAMTLNTQQIWLIPGKDITGEGLIIEVPGFAVDVLVPQAHEMIKLADGKTKVAIRANVVMMCGCPVTPNGLWNANKYEVKALIKRNGTEAGSIPLAFAGKTSTFEGELEIRKEGAYEITVYAFDPATGNAGVDRTTVMVMK